MSTRDLPSRLCLGALATWRVTHLLVAEDGPADAVVRLRARAGDGLAGQLMDCFYCMSAWTALPAAVAVAPRRRDVPLTWLALSGAACLLERATGGLRDDTAGEPAYHEVDDVLWTQAAGDDAWPHAGEPVRSPEPLAHRL
jgi:hypothetical protein